ncbi:S1/P1 nuclease [Thalassotalea ganghwensis]
MRNKIIIRLLALLTLSFPPLSYALSKLGHQLVCQLSYDLLPAQSQKEIDGILSTLSKAEVTLINQYNYQKGDAIVNFASACTWADAIKRDSQYDRYKSWHFINVPRNQAKITARSCQQNCLTQAIIFHARQLKQAKSIKERKEALLFLGHWLGDIHQPLHVSYASDLGGSKVKVVPKFGRCNNLHWYWDQCLLYIEKLPVDSTPFAYLYQQLKHLDLLSAQSVWQEGHVYQWASESISLVRSQRFQYCTLAGEFCKSKDEQAIVITEGYHQHYQDVLLKRIHLAAQRLSNILRYTL